MTLLLLMALTCSLFSSFPILEGFVTGTCGAIVAAQVLSIGLEGVEGTFIMVIAYGTSPHKASPPQLGVVREDKAQSKGE